MNLATILDGHGADAPALVSRGRVTTYGELRDQVARLRGGLAGLGVGPGDRVALVTANNWFFVVSHLAALGTGAAVVPLNPGAAGAELERQLAATEARVAVVGPAARDAFARVDRFAVALEHVLVPEGVRLDAAEPLEPLFHADPIAVVDREPSDLAALLFTAGTSGAPRAAMLTHGNLLANIEQAQAVPERAIRPDDVVLGILPLFHIFGLNVVLGVTLAAGGSVVLAERFDPADALDLIRAHGITVLAGAPPMYVAWAGMPGASPTAMATVRMALSGAARLPEETATAFAARFGVEISEGYGLTEAAPVVTSSVGAGRRAGSVGVPLPGVEVRLVDEEGQDALAGDPGEVWVRGDNVFAGYWRDDEATRAVLTPDGWLRTGDVGVTDDDGFLYLVDRSKDLIIVSGFNVYPAEVEEALLAHPGIAEVVVVGIDHPYTGEAVKAFVVPTAGVVLEADEVIEFCAGRLARYKCPSAVTFLDEIPRGLAGKALRRALREAPEAARG